jgi:hypothetical protein
MPNQSCNFAFDIKHNIYGTHLFFGNLLFADRLLAVSRQQTAVSSQQTADA